VTFEPISINSFTVKWVTGMSATKYEIFVKIGNFWKVVKTTIVEDDDAEEEAGGGDEIFVNMNCFTYTGIKIRMVDGNGKEKDGEVEKITYGI